MRQYWSAVIREAAAETRRSFGLNRRLLINAVGFMVALIFLAVFLNPPDSGQVGEEVRWGVSALVAFFVIVGGAFVVNLVAVPPRMAERERATNPFALEPAAPPEPGAERQFVDVPRRFLTGLYRGRLDVHADAEAQAYVGKWLRVSGRFANLSEYAFGGWLLDLERSSIGVQDDSGFLVIRDEATVDALAAFSPGRFVTIAGRIGSISRHSVELGYCVLVAVTDVAAELKRLLAVGRELRKRWQARAKTAKVRQLGEPRTPHLDDGRDEQWYCEVSAVLEGHADWQELWRRRPEGMYDGVPQTDEAYGARLLDVLVENLQSILNAPNPRRRRRRPSVRNGDQAETAKNA